MVCCQLDSSRPSLLGLLACGRWQGPYPAPLCRARTQRPCAGPVPSAPVPGPYPASLCRARIPLPCAGPASRALVPPERFAMPQRLLRPGYRGCASCHHMGLAVLRPCGMDSLCMSAGRQQGGWLYRSRLGLPSRLRHGVSCDGSARAWPALSVLSTKLFLARQTLQAGFLQIRAVVRPTRLGRNY